MAPRRTVRRAVAISLALAAAALVLARTAPGPTPVVLSAQPSAYCVGAAKVDITPPPAMVASGTFYLGGYGIGPAHAATGVLRPLYSRAIVIGVPDAGGNCPGPAAQQVVIAADDLQG